jgi:hypothetical protein
MNKQSIGICLAGNFDVTMPTERQKLALQELLHMKMTQWSIPIKNIVPHRYFAPKSCYGNLLSDTWAQELVTPPLQKVITKIINFFMNIHDLDGHARVYEVKNKTTGVISTVSAYESEHDRSFGVHLPNGTLIVFPEGTHDNGEYLVRDVETGLAPDGITTVTF